MIMTVEVSSGTLVWTGTTNTGDGTRRIVATGKESDLLDSGNTLVYTGDPNFFGTDTLTVTVDDQGNSPPPAQIATASTSITVNNSNDAPTVGPGANVTFTEDGPAVAIAPAIR